MEIFQMLNDSEGLNFMPYQFLDFSEIEVDAADADAALSFWSSYFAGGRRLNLKGSCQMDMLPASFKATLFQFEGLIATRDVAEIVSSFVGDAIQRFQINYKGSAGEWEMLNVTNALQCPDLQQSDFTHFPKIPGEIMAIRRHVLRRLSRNVPHIFRLAEHLPTVIVSEHFVEEVPRSSPIIGTQFRRLEQY